MTNLKIDSVFQDVPVIENSGILSHPQEKALVFLLSPLYSHFYWNH